MSNITKSQKIRKLIGIGIAVPVIATVIGFLSWGNDLAFNQFANNLTEFFNTDTGSNNDSLVAARAKGNELSRQIVRDGTVLLKNDNNTLPLDKNVDSKINIFGHNAYDFYICGSGSGAIHAKDGEVDLFKAFETNGISYNPDLYQLAYNAGKLGGNNPSTLSNKCENVCVLNEPALTSGVKASAEQYSDVAIVSLGRKAGETEDLPRTQYKKDLPADPTRHYLEISTEEEAILTYCGATFDKVIVIINSTNAMELDFLDTIPGIDACLYSGVTGVQGALGLYDIIYGDYSPSGHLVNTLPRSFEYDMVYWHGGYETTGQYQNANSKAWPYNRNYKRGQERTVFYQDYIEGIYVGYKWFETAYAEGYWDKAPYNGYENVVQFPFGYGKSYTEFEWVIDSLSIPAGSTLDDTSETITAKVKVTNVGQTAGRDVVQIYLTAPYTPGGIEKSYVNLVGYGKTPVINPNETVTINIDVKVSDFESYDCYDKNNNGHKGYELEAGTYELKFMTDAHNLKEGMTNNVVTYEVASTINVDVDEVTGNPVFNKFTGEDAVDGFSSDGSDTNQNVQYISRENFPALPSEMAPHRNWNVIFEISKNGACVNTYEPSIASSWDSKTGNDEFGNPIPTSKPTWGNDKGIDVISGGALTEIGRKLADPANWNSTDWDELLDQVSWDEAIAIINTNSLGRSEGVPTVGRPDGSDADGPQQIGAVAGLGNKVGTGYPGGTLVAQNWSQSVAFSLGKSYGADMQAVGRSGAYGFGCNIQRTPFCGRNFEYYSEDAFISAQCAANASRGVAVNGKYCFLKHFAVNNQEFHRVGLYTWLSEQALREIYLKPFKEAVLHGELSAVMSSFNRVGATWTGGSTALIQGVLRNEWGFKGMVITDYCESWELMQQAQAVRAGSNYGMTMTYTQGGYNSLPTQAGSSIRLQHRIRQSVKEVIYGYIHPLLVNSNYNESADSEEFIVSTPGKKPWEYWRPLIISLDAIIIGGMLYWAYIAFRPIPDPKPVTNTKVEKQKGGKKDE